MGQKGLKLAFLGQKWPFLAEFFLNRIGGYWNWGIGQLHVRHRDTWSGLKHDVYFEVLTNYLSQDCVKLCKILDLSEMFLMADLKAPVEDLAVNILNKSNVKELCAKADMFACSHLLEACVQLMVKEGISLDKEEVKKMPDATVAYLGAF